MTTLSSALPTFYQKKKKVPLGANQMLRFAPGRGYYATPKGTNPYFQTIYDNKGAPALPSPPLDPILSRAQSHVSGLTNPLLDMLAKQQAEAEARARGVYQAHSQNLEGALTTAAAPLAGIYGRGVEQATAVQEAIANRLQGAGQDAESSLARQLAQINAPGNTPAEIGQFYQDASSSGFASGMSDVQRMISEGAAAQAFAAKQPGIARLAAGQDLSAALSGIGQQFGAQRQDILRQIPEMTMDFYERRMAERQAELERRQKDRLAKWAVADENQRMKLQRQWQVEDRNFDAQLRREMAQLESMTGGGGYNLQGTGTASQWLIDPRTGQVVGPNPNYIPPSPAVGGDTVQTPGSAKRNRVVQSAWNSVTRVREDGATGFNQNVLQKLRKFPMSADAILNTAINAALKAQGVKPNSKEGIQIRNGIRQRMNGMSWRANDGKDYTFRNK